MKYLLIGLVALVIFSTNCRGERLIIRVDKDQGTINPEGFGDNWGGRAYKYLQDALMDATVLMDNYEGIEIWVASSNTPYNPSETKYHPDGYNDRESSFFMIQGVDIFGGFEGNEEVRSERDVKKNETVLTGRLPSLRSFHVVEATLVSGVRLDGFTIEEGMANGYVEEGKGQGSAITVRVSHLIVSNCTFRRNIAGTGTVCSRQNSFLEIYNCKFFDNDAFYGSGLHAEYRGTPADILAVNNIFENNRCYESGTISIDTSCNVSLFNCNILNNTSDDLGPGIVNVGTLNMKNSIVWGNRITNNEDYVNWLIDFGVDWEVTNILASCLEDDLENDGVVLFDDSNIDTRPSLNQNFSLSCRDNCLNRGIIQGYPLDIWDIDEDGIINELVPDIQNKDRVTFNNIDIGAVEGVEAEILQPSLDLNNDGLINSDDISVILDSWGTDNIEADISPYCSPDRIVNFLDLSVLLSGIEEQ